MEYKNILYSKFAGPAAVIEYHDGVMEYLDINDGFLPELWMNISKEEFLASDISRSLDEDNYARFLRNLILCIESGEEQIVETRRDTFTDCCGFDSIYLKSRLVPLDSGSDRALVFEAVSNITNERNTRENLEDIEYRYKSALEQINIYNWEYTIATKEMRPCYRCMRDLGLPALVTDYPEPAIEAGIFPPDYADMYREMMRKVDSGVEEIEADIPLTVGRVPFRVKYTTEFDEEGNPVKAFGSATLISETELGHIKLDNQIIATLAEGYRCIYLADFVNDTVNVIKQSDIMSIPDGVDCGELVSRVGSLFTGDDTDDQVPTDVEYIRNTAFTDSDMREYVYKDEPNDRWVRIGYHVIERGGNRVDRLLITASVIDDNRARQMDADKLIAAQNAELEARQKMLVAAIDEANRANQAKTKFFSNMSHDIRTPMSAITGFSRLAMDDIDNKELLEDHLNRIVTAGDHLMNLINDILDMSRIESGKMELKTSPVRIRDLLNECADMVRVKMSENKLNFIVNTDDTGDDIVDCDKLRFNQVILNLLSNAYKFTPEGGSVFLEAAVRDRSDVITYEIHVRDTGIGMSPQFRDRIWEAYTREDSDMVRETQGTGLGMVIVRNIVNMMNGKITLDSEQGRGSEFTIILPLTPTAEDAADRPADRSLSDALSRNYDGITVMVVDDTAVNLKLADRILKGYGFNVIQASSGIDAIRILQDPASGDIDLILMDVMMPVMDGLETTGRIRKLPDPALSSIPIVAMTANAFDSDVQAALDAGMNAHIAKPFRKEELILTINDNL